jgi:hypothetical protein
LNYERLFFTRHAAYFPHIENPRTFSEKIVWRKLYQDLPFAKIVCDKLAVREYVSGIVGEKYVNTLLATTKSGTDVDYEKLPSGFVAKANHGSKLNVLVRNKANIDLSLLTSTLIRCLNTDFGHTTNEWWYKEIEPVIVFEQLLADEEFGLPLDYNFFVFQGIAEMVCANFDRFGRHKQSFYDLNWNQMDLQEEFPLAPPLAAPARLAEMKEVAEALAVGFDFARVDLYCVNDRDIIFGEITLAPGSGWLRFRPHEADFRLGALWQLDTTAKVSGK